MVPRDRILELQERGYRRLAEQLGWEPDPVATHRRLALPPTPLDVCAAEKFREAVAGQADLSPQQWHDFDQTVRAIFERYTDSVMPTSYEDPNTYRLMSMMFDGLQNALICRGKALVPPPLFATLPSGDANARVVQSQKSRVPIILFEQGLFPFLAGFARIISWATPPLTLAQTLDDRALYKLTTRYTMPFETSSSLLEFLISYVVNSAPAALPAPGHNRVAEMSLLGGMQRFIMAHELAHIRLGHLASPPNQDHEFAADVGGIEHLLMTLSDTGDSWAMGVWSVNAALLALHYLYNTIGILEYGVRDFEWTSVTHPSPQMRREYIRKWWTREKVPCRAIVAANKLCSMTQSQLKRLFDFIIRPCLLEAHNGGARPSPLWKDSLTHCFTARS